MAADTGILPQDPSQDASQAPAQAPASPAAAEAPPPVADPHAPLGIADLTLPDGMRRDVTGAAAGILAGQRDRETHTFDVVEADGRFDEAELRRLFREAGVMFHAGDEKPDNSLTPAGG